MAKSGNAGLALGADAKHSTAEEAANAYMKQLEGKKLELDYKGTMQINGFDAAWLEVKKKNAKSAVVWLKIGEGPGVLQVTGTAKDEQGFQAIVKAINTLQPVQQADDKLITEMVMRFEHAPDMTLKEYGESKGADEAMIKWLELINGLKPEDKLNDEYVKYIEVRPYPVAR